jgi:putative transposase
MPSEKPNAHWHHAPPHLFVSGASYMITAGTHWKRRLFDSPEKLDYLQQTIFERFGARGWVFEAWAIFSNHYHLIVRAPEDAESLRVVLRDIHADTARWLNQCDGDPGRKVWFNYRDTCLTYQKSYLARLHYVHANPVKHGLVGNAEDYDWSSMAWFMREAKPSFMRTVLSFRIDKLNIPDDY